MSYRDAVELTAAWLAMHAALAVQLAIATELLMWLVAYCYWCHSHNRLPFGKLRARLFIYFLRHCKNVAAREFVAGLLFNIPMWMRNPPVYRDVEVTDDGDGDATVELRDAYDSNPHDHDSSPNGCHEDCRACKWQRGEKVA